MRSLIQWLVEELRPFPKIVEGLKAYGTGLEDPGRCSSRSTGSRSARARRRLSTRTSTSGSRRPARTAFKLPTRGLDDAPKLEVAADAAPQGRQRARAHLTRARLPSTPATPTRRARRPRPRRRSTPSSRSRATSSAPSSPPRRTGAARRRTSGYAGLHRRRPRQLRPCAARLAQLSARAGGPRRGREAAVRGEEARPRAQLPPARRVADLLRKVGAARSTRSPSSSTTRSSRRWSSAPLKQLVLEATPKPRAAGRKVQDVRRDGGVRRAPRIAELLRPRSAARIWSSATARTSCSRTTPRS